jgi:hypothetical protein
MDRFYVYSHIKKTDGKCFYIGKGTGNRAKSEKGRNEYWHRIVNKHGFESIILVNNISEEKAFELESLICEQIGYENLCNITKQKGRGHSKSEETKQKLSVPRPNSGGKGKPKPGAGNFNGDGRPKGIPCSEETKQKLKVSRPNSGFKGPRSEKTIQKLKKPKSEESKQKMRKPHLGSGPKGPRPKNVKEKLRKSSGKGIIQLDLNGNFIKEWFSYNEVRENGFKGVQGAIKRNKPYKGFYWKKK